MEPATALPPPRQEEDLPKMSFGDHLEELRRRLLRSLIAVGVCVLGMLPFKQTVTWIYIQPYRSMWLTGFVDYSDDLKAKVADEQRRLDAATDEGEREILRESLDLWRDKDVWLDRHRASILAGTYNFTDHGDLIRSRGGYAVSYSLMATRPIEDFWTFMAASFLFSVLLAGPYVLYQAWAFVAAGLYRNERKVALRYVPGACVLLALGVLFGYFVVVPYGLYFLVKLMNFGQVQPLITVSTYFSLLFMLTAALGLVFQLPLVMLVLQKIGVVSHETLKKNWRYVILILFVVAALFTPPDPFTQSMMALPMVVLYLFGLWLTGRSARRMARLAGGGGAA